MSGEESSVNGGIVISKRCRAAVSCPTRYPVVVGKEGLAIQPSVLVALWHPSSPVAPTFIAHSAPCTLWLTNCCSFCTSRPFLSGFCRRSLTLRSGGSSTKNTPQSSARMPTALLAQRTSPPTLCPGPFCSSMGMMLRDRAKWTMGASERTDP